MSDCSCNKFKVEQLNVNLEEKDGFLFFNNCWNDASCRFKFKKDPLDDISFLKNLSFPEELSAIYHKDEQLYEFIFAPLNNDFTRKFNYIYDGKKFELFYTTPTSKFEKLACNFQIGDTEDISDRAFSLMRYLRYYKKRGYIKQELYPINFFIKGNFNEMTYSEHIEFFKQVNFLMTYYDRKSPFILINNSIDADPSRIKTPCKMNKYDFPTILNSKKYDSTLIDLLEAARTTTSIRLKYIFYYQVIEYCSYYYIENELKRRVENIIRTPDILNSNSYSQSIIELFSDYLKNKPDSQRMNKLLCDFCEYDDIKDEILTNEDFFTEDTIFEGGLKINKIFNKKEDINNPPNGIIDLIRKNIDTIRNVLVHSRESRENTLIVPTQTNNVRLMPYLYLLRRIAEVIVIKYVP